MGSNKSNTFNLMMLSPGAERLLLTLIYYAGTRGVCFPSQDTLMRALKIVKKPVLRRYVDELVSHNLVSYQKSFTSRKLSNGKVIPAPQIKYFIVSNKLYLTNGNDSSGLYINFTSRELPFGTIQKVTGTIHNTVSKDTGDKTQEPKAVSPYKSLVVEFNRKYGTDLFPVFGKQAASIRKILQSYTEADIWNCAEWLGRQKWWKEHGFDFTSIQSQIGKYKMSLRSDKSKEVYRDAHSI